MPRPGRILRAEAAPVGADAGLHRAQALGVGVAGDEAGLAEIGPDRRQVFLLDAEHVDALAAGDLDRRDLELVDDVGDGAQFVGVGHAAPHARHDRIGAVLLDVGVDALVDEARLVVVGIFVRPVADEIVVERRPALGAAARGLPLELLHDGGNGLQALGLDQAAHVVMAERRAAAHRLHGGRIVGVAERQRHQLLDEAGAGAAGGRGLGVGAHVVERGQALGRDRAGDLALAYAVAAADFRIIRQGCNGRHRVQRGASLVGLAEDQRVAHRRRCRPGSSSGR